MKNLIEKIDEEIQKTKAEASIGGNHTDIVNKLTGLRIAKDLILSHVRDRHCQIDAQSVVLVEDLIGK